METSYTIAFGLIFIASCLLIITCTIFSVIGILKRLILLLCAIVLLVAPHYFQLDAILSAGSISVLISLGLCIFPISFMIVIQYMFSQYRPISIIPVYALSAVSFFLLLFLHGNSGLIVFILYLAAYLYALYMIFPSVNDYVSAILPIFIFLNIVYMSITLYTLDNIHFILSAGFMGIALSFFIGITLNKRLTGLMNRFSAVNELNKKLNHQISRLKQSNDSYRKIILEKDLELQQMSRHASLAELTAGIAHELAQPLTGIKGIAQNMIDDINAEEFENLQAVSELLRICSLVDKSSSIINHIRNFSKKRIISKKPVDLNKVILDAIDLIQNQLKKNDIDLIFVLDDKIPKIIGDKISLEQLIVNIILNSKDAILEKGFDSSKENGTIRITTFSPNNAVTMIIQDNGTGISDDIMHKIWSPFFTTKKRDHGTGIGLSICSKILKDHDALVDIKSDSQGTQFVISFPVYADGESAAQ
jgi:signal transduction histidine kinase